MSSEGKELFDQYGSYAGIATLAATVRMMLSSERYTFYGRCRVYTIAVFVAWLFYLLLHPSTMDTNWKVGSVGIAALLADDILRAIINLGQKFLGKPLEILADYFRK